MQPLPFFRCYLRPWFLIPIVFFITLYLFMLCGNYTTYRILSWKLQQAQVARECIQEAKQASTQNTDNIVKSGAEPEAAAKSNSDFSSIPSFSLLPQGNVRLIHAFNSTLLLLSSSPQSLPASCTAATKPLSDLMRQVVLQEVITDPPYRSPRYSAWKTMVDLQPLFWPLLLIVIVLWQCDVVRIAELVALELWILGANGIAHILTIVPDASGYHPTCHAYTLSHLGTWIFTRVSSEYCGDMIWSGHTFHTLLAMIMLGRVLKNERRIHAEEKRSKVDCGEEEISTQQSSFSFNSFFRSIPTHLHRFCIHSCTYYSFLLLVLICFLFEMYGILTIRYHYSLDIFIASMITLLATTSNWIRWSVVWMYYPHILEEIVEEAREKEKATAEEKTNTRKAKQDQLETPFEQELTTIPHQQVDEPETVESETTRDEQKTKEVALDVRPEGRSGGKQSELDDDTKSTAKFLLRGSDRTIRYLSFPTRHAYQERLNRIGYC